MVKASKYSVAITITNPTETQSSPSVSVQVTLKDGGSLVGSITEVDMVKPGSFIFRRSSFSILNYQCWKQRNCDDSISMEIRDSNRFNEDVLVEEETFICANAVTIMVMRALLFLAIAFTLFKKFLSLIDR